MKKLLNLALIAAAIAAPFASQAAPAKKAVHAKKAAPMKKAAAAATAATAAPQPARARRTGGHRCPNRRAATCPRSRRVD